MSYVGDSYGSNKDARWWRSDIESEDRYKALTATVQLVEHQQDPRRESDYRFVRLYGNTPLAGFGAGKYMRRPTATGSRLAFNIVKNCCDALTAKLTKDRPKVTFLTTGGDWHLQQRARQLDAFVEAQFYEGDLYETSAQLVLDACIVGTGCLKIFREGSGDESRIVYERVFPWELVVDDAEGMYGKPRNLYQRRFIDRIILEEEYKYDEAILDKLRTTTSDRTAVEHAGYDSTADQLLVTEAWHLKSGQFAKDGRHTICVDNVTLLDERYDKGYFPFCFFRRQRAPEGFWGIGLAEELMGIQLEMNVLLQKVQRSHHLMAAAHWLVRNGSAINSAQIDNDIGSIIRFTGDPPQAVVPTAVTPDVYAHFDRLNNAGYEISGVNRLEAQAQKPPGLNSGKAMLVYGDIATDRFVVAGRNYQGLFLNAARQTIDLAREIAKDYPDFEMKAHSKGTMSHIRFLDVDLKDNDRVLKMYPTNAFASDPAAKLEQISEYMNAGIIAPNVAQRLLDLPDLEADMSLERASYDIVMDILDGILNHDPPLYVGPEPLMNLAEAMGLMTKAYLRAKVNGVEESRLEMVREWLRTAKVIKDRESAPAPAMAPGAPPGPSRPGVPPGPPPPPPPGMNGAGQPPPPMAA